MNETMNLPYTYYWTDNVFNLLIHFDFVFYELIYTYKRQYNVITK